MAVLGKTKMGIQYLERIENRSEVCTDTLSELLIMKLHALLQLKRKREALQLIRVHEARIPAKKRLWFSNLKATALLLDGNPAEAKEVLLNQHRGVRRQEKKRAELLLQAEGQMRQ